VAGTWDPTSNASNTLPGLYVRFTSLANAQVSSTVASRGVVAIPLVTYGTATAKTVYTINDITTAENTFGAANVQSIKNALSAGAAQVLVYTLEAIDGTTVTEKIAYDDARAVLDTYNFDVFAYDGIVSATEQDDCVRWVKQNRDLGKHYFAVVGCVVAADDLDPSIGNARSVRVKDDYVLNLISGVVTDGVTQNSAQFASYVAGAVASCPLQKSITFLKLPVDDVTKRLAISDIKNAVANGSLVLVNNGEFVRLEQGITTNLTKIRKEKVRQTVSTSITRSVEASVIGQITNDSNGAAYVQSMVKLYLESLQAAEVLTNIQVGVDKTEQSVGDQLYITVSYLELDSIEQVFLSIFV
jgi:hypothetical protein